MINAFDKQSLIEAVEKLTAGGGITAPDDMVYIDDVNRIIESMSGDYKDTMSRMHVMRHLSGVTCECNIDMTSDGVICEGLNVSGEDIGDWTLQQMMKLKEDIESIILHMMDKSIHK